MRAKDRCDEKISVMYQPMKAKDIISAAKKTMRAGSRYISSNDSRY